MTKLSEMYESLDSYGLLSVGDRIKIHDWPMFLDDGEYKVSEIIRIKEGDVRVLLSGDWRQKKHCGLHYFDDREFLVQYDSVMKYMYKPETNVQKKIRRKGSKSLKI